MRVANRPLAFILAAALLAGSVVVIAEVIGFAAHHSPLLVHWTTWYQLGRQDPLGRLRGPGLGRRPDRRRRCCSWAWSSSPAASPGCRCGPATTPPTPP